MLPAQPMPISMMERFLRPLRGGGNNPEFPTGFAHSLGSGCRFTRGYNPPPFQGGIAELNNLQ
jgi:hypothetical protein